MKVILLLLSFCLISCSSRPVGDDESQVTTQSSTNTSGEGALDQVMKNKECGLFDVFYDGCKTIYSDAEKSLYKKE